MPTFSSLSDFGDELARFQRELERERKRIILRDAAEKAQQLAERAASGDLGGDPKFSGWLPTLDTQIRQKPNGEAWVIPTRAGAGPWTVAQRGRNAGETGRFLGPGATRSGGAVRRRGDGSVARTRASRGRRWNGVTRGKGTADKAVAAMEREIPQIIERGVRAALERHFDVS
jgi:hypothetical protein